MPSLAQDISQTFQYFAIKFSKGKIISSATILPNMSKKISRNKTVPRFENL